MYENAGVPLTELEPCLKEKVYIKVDIVSQGVHAGWRIPLCSYLAWKFGRRILQINSTHTMVQLEVEVDVDHSPRPGSRFRYAQMTRMLFENAFILFE